MLLVSVFLLNYLSNHVKVAFILRVRSSFQAVTFFQVVTKLINRNWFPVQLHFYYLLSAT